MLVALTALHEPHYTSLYLPKQLFTTFKKIIVVRIHHSSYSCEKNAANYWQPP